VWGGGVVYVIDVYAVYDVAVCCALCCAYIYVIYYAHHIACASHTCIRYNVSVFMYQCFLFISCGVSCVYPLRININTSTRKRVT